jgi:hypothetical protein
MEDSKQNNIWKSAIQQGFVIGILSYALGFMGNQFPSFNALLLLLSMGLTIAIFYKALVRFRDRVCEGMISFGKAFQYGFLMALTGSFIRTFTNYFTSNLSSEEKEEIIMEQLGALESSGMDAEILETFASVMETIMEPGVLAMISFAFYMIYGILLTSIVAMVVKRDGMEA